MHVLYPELFQSIPALHVVVLPHRFNYGVLDLHEGAVGYSGVWSSAICALQFRNRNGVNAANTVMILVVSCMSQAVATGCTVKPTFVFPRILHEHKYAGRPPIAVS